MNLDAKIFEGGVFIDHRGFLEYNNNLEFFEIKRFYIITSPEKEFKRAWRGHKKESKIFTVLDGLFDVTLIVPDSFEAPKQKLSEKKFLLDSNKNQSLLIPGGHFIGFTNKLPNSKMIVHSDLSLKESKLDDYKLDANHWIL